MKVLMVCLGNICRSPLAEGILRHKAAQLGLNIEVDSAGTGSWHVGESPDKRSVDVASRNNIDISGLLGRQFKVHDFDDFDKILVMDESNYKNVLSLARNGSDRSKVQYILNYSAPDSNACVPDPYFGGPEGFDNVYKMLDQACDSFLRTLNAQQS